MRLLLLSSEFPPGPGGIGTHAYQLASQLVHLKWDVHVLTSQDYVDPENIVPFNCAQDFGITQLPRTNSFVRNALFRWKYFRSLIKTIQPDVLVVTGDQQVWLAALMQVYLKIVFQPYRFPWCAIWHGVIPRSYVTRQMTCWAFGQSDLTITVSQYSRRRMIDMGVRPHRNLTITNGADEERFYPDYYAGLELRAKLGLSDALILLTVGHVSERKGQDIVIRALPRILQSMPNVHYLIVGLPTRQAPLEKLAIELGVSEYVHFLGRVDADALCAVYNACDVFVLTSRHSSDGEFEGYGIVAAEAALCAKPSIVADNSGLPEAVQNGRTGLIVPENDPLATARAIQNLLQTPSLRKQMGERARQCALRKRTWSTCMRKYDKVLSQLIVGHRGRCS
jgi:phosphatidyl-myo-inositol dimannoside synthase